MNIMTATRKVVMALILFSCVFFIASSMSSSRDLVLSDKQRRTTNLNSIFGHHVNQNRKKRLAVMGAGASSIFSGVYAIFGKIMATINKNKLFGTLDQLKNELESLSDQMQLIDKSLREVKLSVSYWQTEKEIKASTRTLMEYLQHPTDEYRRNEFFNQAASVNKHVNHLFDGLLNKNAFSPDIMIILKDYHKCHARNLIRSIDSLMKLLVSGFAVHLEYVRQRNISTIWADEERFTHQTKDVETRLDGMALECRTDESHVEDEMRSILTTEMDRYSATGSGKRSRNSTVRNQIMAAAVLNFLEDKYDTKLWTVIVISGSNCYTSVDTAWYIRNQNVCHRFHSYSDGFHSILFSYYSSVNAVSVDKSNVAYLSSLAEMYTHQFKLQFQITPGQPDDLKKKHKIYMDECLDVMRTKMVTEYLTLYKDNSYDPHQNSRSAIVYSKDSPNIRIVMNYSRSTHLVLIVPIRPAPQLHLRRSNNQTSSSVGDSVCEYKLNSAGSRPLRSQFNSMYLTVKDNSKKDRALIVLDKEWRNDTGQRWRFVNNQLRNDHGKCLSAYHKSDSYLYQYDCSKNWKEMLWYRNGMQIVNGRHQCLYLRYQYSLLKTAHYDRKYRFNRKDIYNAFHHDCSHSNFELFSYWNDWEFNCPIANKLTHQNSDGTIAVTFINEFSKRYLTIKPNEVGGRERRHPVHIPWTNQLGQFWIITSNDTLINANGECLDFDGVTGLIPWELFITDNDCHKKQWIYNERHQIVHSQSKLCLTARIYTRTITLDHCDGEADQRWIKSSSN